MAGDDLGSLRFGLEVDYNSLNHAASIVIPKADEVLKQLDATTRRTTSGWSTFSKQAAATALGLIGANGIDQAIRTIMRSTSDSVKTFAAFQKGMKEVSTLVDTSQVNMGKLTQEVLGLSRAYGMDAKGLSKALYQTISAGIEAGDAIKFLETATKAAIGGVTDTKTAVDTLTSALAAYGMDADQATEASDSLFVAVKLGKTTWDELAGSIGQVAPLASAIGVTLDEVNNSMAALTLSGLSTAESGTALRGMFNALLKPSEEAVVLAEKLGIEFSVAGVRAQGFSAWLNDLAKKTGGSVEAMSVLFNEVRGMNGALQLTGAALDRYNEGLEEFADKAGATETASDKMKDSLAFDWDQYAAGVAGAAESLVKKMEPALRKVLRTGRDLAEGLKYYLDIWSQDKMRDEGESLMKSYMQENPNWSKVLDSSKEWISQYYQGAANPKGAPAGYRDKSFDAMLEQTMAILGVAQKEVSVRKEIVAETEKAVDKEKERAEAAERAKRLAEEVASKKKEQSDFEKGAARELKIQLDQQEEDDRRNYEGRKTAEAAIAQAKLEGRNTSIAGMRAEIEAIERGLNIEKLGYQDRAKLHDLLHDKKMSLYTKEAESRMLAISEMERVEIQQAAGHEATIKAIQDRYKELAQQIRISFGQQITQQLSIDAKFETTELKNFKNEFRSAVGDFGKTVNFTFQDASIQAQVFGDVISQIFSENNDSILSWAGLVIGLLEKIFDDSDNVGVNLERTSSAAVSAAKAFLLAAGKWEVDLMSTQEVREKRDEIGADFVSYLQGLGFKVEDGDLGSILQANAYRGTTVSDSLGEKNFGKDDWAWMKDILLGKKSYDDIDAGNWDTPNRDRIHKKISNYYELLGFSSGGSPYRIKYNELDEEVSTREFATPGSTEEIDVDTLGTFRGVETVLRGRKEAEGRSDEWFYTTIWPYVVKFWDTLDWATHQQYQTRYQQASTATSQPQFEQSTSPVSVSLSGESAYTPNVPSWDEYYGSVMGAVQGAVQGGSSGAIVEIRFPDQLNVQVTGDAVGVESAAIIADKISDSITTYAQSQGGTP